MADLYKYRIWCETESAYFSIWAEEAPTVCPNNNGHTIDESKTSITEENLDEGPKTGPDGKMMVYESSRPLGTKIYFTCEGDNNDNSHEVGGGSSTYIVHNVGDSTSQELYVDFNTVDNITYIHEGYVTWTGCKGDTLTMEFIPSVTPVTPSAGDSMFMLMDQYGQPSLTEGFIIAPAAGNGNINVDTTSMVLVSTVPSFDDGSDNDPGYWNSDFDTTTKQFGPITPNYTGEGRYNMFAAPVILKRFINKMTLIGNGFIQLQTAESEQVPHNIRMKITITTLTPDHEWSCSCLIVLHRKKTC